MSTPFVLASSQVSIDGTEVPAARESFTAVTLSVDGAVSDSVYCFGGIGLAGRLDCTMVYDVGRARWRRLPIRGAGPCARSHHAAVAVGQNMYIFGGEGEVAHAEGSAVGAPTSGSVPRKLLGDMFRLDVSTRRWHSIGYSNDCYLPGFRK